MLARSLSNNLAALLAVQLTTRRDTFTCFEAACWCLEACTRHMDASGLADEEDLDMREGCRFTAWRLRYVIEQ